MSNTEILVTLKISADEYQRIYQGTASDVVTRAHDGRRVRFPGRILRPFVGYNGIEGCFRIMFDENNRFQAIEKIA